MRVLGISGTPRRGGNSEILLEYGLRPFQEAGWEVSKVLLSEKEITPCTGCETCLVTGVCQIEDDMQEIYEQYTACDAVIISCPTYWKGVPSQLKALIDRTFSVWGQKVLAGKPGGAIVVGREENGGQSIVSDVLYTFFRFCGMIGISGDYDVTGVADKPGDVLEQKQLLAAAEELGKRVLQSMSSTL